ncbi:flagellar motor switch protein FliN [Nocardioides sp. AE5]|uniref:flagellar motor switch protein FliN n=1 Tax=Nocardioides sp. AE5 TaxID=2962573 RepID=UPI002881D1E4|nr:flagellar motor switch protein FliN [Nocardioides sp. AE5]MDT0200789.1 flagellar motor switch protein FliN [Nocardioides sp. AE5]
MTSDLTGNELAQAVAAEVAAVLPAALPLTASVAQPGNEHVTAAFAGAVVAEVNGARSGVAAILVGNDLVEAMANSPLGGLDLAAATQPAIDTLARSLSLAAGAAAQVEIDTVVATMAGPFTVVPLIGAGIDAAVLVQDRLLEQVRGPEFTAGATPVPPAPAQPTSAGSPSVGTVPGQAHAQPAPVHAVPTPQPEQAVPAAGRRGIEMLHGVVMEVTVELGRTRMTVRDLLALSPGAVLELDRAAGSPADLLVNGRLIARGEVVVVDEDFGLRITEVLDEAAAS